jgi:hypothetical protein
MLLYIALLFLVGIVYKFHVVETVANTVTIKRRKLVALSNLVRTQYNNIFSIFWVCACIIVKNFYLSFLQTVNNNVRFVDKNTYDISYVINGVRYTLRVKCKKGPRMLIQALDENDNDITEVIQAYLGPYENFHMSKLTPADLGLGSVTIHNSFGTELHIDKNDQLCISL